MLEELFARAQEHYARQELPQAEDCFRQILEQQPADEQALQSLVVICLQTDRKDEAIAWLERLVKAYPENPLYRARLATVHESRGDWDAAVDVYRQLLEARPELNDSRFNYARLLTRAGRAQEALEQYQQCLDRGISEPEEVLTQIGIVLGDLNLLDDAEDALRDALQRKSGYLPALYNLGLLQEERGQWPDARLTFTDIVDADGHHVNAMARLAHGEVHREPPAMLMRKMNRALDRQDTPPQDRETLYYAIGKVLDDCGEYDRAFANFEAANSLSLLRSQPYDPAAHSAMTDRIIELCDGDWLAAIEPVSEAPLVFISGMFRSGSTLLEQILGAHPALTAGGEIGYLPRAIGRLPGRYPECLTAEGVDLAELGNGYLAELETLYGADVRLIDKRPDNFLYLGLIKSLFPRARVLHTVRDPMDTGISVYTQALADHLGYANRLEDIGHYWRQYRRLMAHWQSMLQDTILDVSYEGLVKDSRATVAGALNFLGLDWHDNCATFHRHIQRVRTASVSQVRRDLHTGAIGRWKNYEQQLEPLRRALEG